MRLIHLVLSCPWRRSGTGSVAQPQQSVPIASPRPPAPQPPLAPVPQVAPSQSFLAHFGNLFSWATAPRAAVPRSTMAPYTAYANSLVTSLVAPGIPPGDHASSLPVDLPPAWLRGHSAAGPRGIQYYGSGQPRPYAGLRVAITLMTRKPHRFEWWLRYHLSLGICHVFVHVEDTPELLPLLASFTAPVQRCHPRTTPRTATTTP